MSVLKSKRKPSQFEVFHHLNKLRKEITDLLLRDFGYNAVKSEKRLERRFGSRSYEELTGMRRKLKKLAGRLSEKEFYNLYHSWMENHYRIMSRQQRANMNDLYNKLKEEHYHVQTDFG